MSAFGVEGTDSAVADRRYSVTLLRQTVTTDPSIARGKWKAAGEGRACAAGAVAGRKQLRLVLFELAKTGGIWLWRFHYPSFPKHFLENLCI